MTFPEVGSTPMTEYLKMTHHTLWEQLFCILVWRGLSLISNHIRLCADLSVLLVRRGVVGDLEEVQVDDFFHLIVVSSTLTYNHRRIEQEDVPVVQRCHYV